MFNHFHLLAAFVSRRQMDSFMNGVTSTFARMYNRKYKLSGKLFRRPYRSAPKFTDKKIRENIVYILNNPVEKNATSAAWRYRWNFYRYLESDHPFSEPIVFAEASRNLLDLMREVKNRKIQGLALNYGLFDFRYYSLDDREKAQFIDYCICEYMAIDKELIISKYGSIESAYKAAETVMGSEYDISDDDGIEDYRHYVKITEILADEGYSMERTRLSVSDDDYSRIERRLRKEVRATDYEINKYFHRT